MDKLTGLPTHLDAPRVLAERYASAAGLTAIFFDIAEFKSYNDRWGHTSGDEALVRLGAWLQSVAAKHGADLFRVGGDEFLLLLSTMRLEEAVPLAREIVACAETAMNAVAFTTRSGFENDLSQVRNDCADAIYKARLAAGNQSRVVTVM